MWLNSARPISRLTAPTILYSDVVIGSNEYRMTLSFTRNTITDSDTSLNIDSPYNNMEHICNVTALLHFGFGETCKYHKVNYLL